MTHAQTTGYHQRRDKLACLQGVPRVSRSTVVSTMERTMTMILRGTVLLAAVFFIVISASMNALFLSSFGRNAVETGLLAGISVAGDVVKAVLPVVVMRALALRLWGQAALAAVMLAVVVAMSLASGLGFAALTRSASTVVQTGSTATLQARIADLSDVEARLVALPAARSRPLVDSEIASAQLDRLWKLSKSCTDITGPASREFCARVIGLRSELATTVLRDDLETERRTLRATIAELRARGAGADADPQTTALADLFGTDKTTPRAVMTSALAVVLEFGSLVLVLLAAGPALRDPRAPEVEPEPVRTPIAVPASADRTHWHRQRTGGSLSVRREDP